MSVLTWDEVGERRFETGVDHGVLYVRASDGSYPQGVPWNGLTAVNEAPTGAEANAVYADNMKYLNLISAEEFEATIEAFTYPLEFEACDGSAEVAPGLTIGQQPRKTFGFAYRTLIGNDVEGTDLGEKIHLVYGALASPTEKARATVNDTPEATPFSWSVTTTPVPITGFKPSAKLTINSLEVAPDRYKDLKDAIYGTVATEAHLPTPSEVMAILEDDRTVVTPTAPTFTPATNTITIPTVTGVTYSIDGTTVSAGPTVITETTTVIAAPSGALYRFPTDADTDWVFVYTP